MKGSGHLARKIELEPISGRISHTAMLLAALSTTTISSTGCTSRPYSSPQEAAQNACRAKIGVHSASLSGDENLLTLDVTALMARNAAALGVPPSVLGRMITTVPLDMAWLTDDELRQMNVKREGLPAPKQDASLRITAGMEPLTRSNQQAIALPNVREPLAGDSNELATLAYHPGDARDRASLPLADPLPIPSSKMTSLGSPKPLYVASGQAISAAPQYRPGT